MNLPLDTKSYSPQTAYVFLHRLLLELKLSHYITKQYPAHEAIGATYSAIEGMIDGITEELMGYSGVDPTALAIGTVSAMTPVQLADHIIKDAGKLLEYASKKGWHNVENVAAELSGAGAKLKFLSRY
jgi:hypothetical protein